MAPFDALYGRIYRYPIGWYEASEDKFLGPNIVHQALEKVKVKVICDRFKTAQSCQKSYMDMRHKDSEFSVSHSVFLKVSPIKGVMWFRKRESLVSGMLVPI